MVDACDDVGWLAGRQAWICVSVRRRAQPIPGASVSSRLGLPAIGLALFGATSAEGRSSSSSSRRTTRTQTQHAPRSAQCLAAGACDEMFLSSPSLLPCLSPSLLPSFHLSLAAHRRACMHLSMQAVGAFSGAAARPGAVLGPRPRPPHGTSAAQRSVLYVPGKQRQVGGTARHRDCCAAKHLSLSPSHAARQRRNSRPPRVRGQSSAQTEALPPAPHTRQAVCRRWGMAADHDNAPGGKREAARWLAAGCCGALAHS